MTHKVQVNGIKLYAFHGCLPQEGKIGGSYIVDVEVGTDFTPSFVSDDLNDTVDYVFINKVVKEEMAIRSKLIEHVGYRIVQRIKTELSGIQKVKVCVTKLSPPINGDVENVSITIKETFKQ
jgi:dihydroneopterin aldolase